MNIMPRLVQITITITKICQPKSNYQTIYATQIMMYLSWDKTTQSFALMKHENDIFAQMHIYFGNT